MNAAHYELAYSMSGIGFGPWFVVVLGALLLCAAVLVLRGPAPASVKVPLFRAIAFKTFILLVGVVWTLAGAMQLLTAYRLSRAAANLSTLQVVEGPVRNFHRTTTARGIVTESFCVQSMCFEYSDGHMSSGLNPSDPPSRLIREGRPVRVGYVSGTIVRLEVAK